MRLTLFDLRHTDVDYFIEFSERQEKPKQVNECRALFAFLSDESMNGGKTLVPLLTNSFLAI